MSAAYDEERARQVSPRIADLVAEERGRFDSAERERDRGEKEGVLEPRRGDELRRRNGRRRSEPREHDGARDDEEDRRNPGRDGGGVVQPRGVLETTDVRGGGEDDAQKRERQEEAPVLLERRTLRAPEEERVRGREVEQSREERQVARPVEESRHEPREVSERAARPHVEPALLRVARRKLEDRGHERNEEPESREDPDHERGRPGLGGRRDPPEAEARQRVEKDEVPEAEDSPELHQRSGARGGSIAAAQRRWK